MRVAYRSDVSERIEICPRSRCRVIEPPTPPHRLEFLMFGYDMAEREVTGPAQRDVRMGGERTLGSSHHRELVLFREDPSNSRAHGPPGSSMTGRSTTREIAIVLYVEIGKIRILRLSKGDGNVFIFMAARGGRTQASKRVSRRGLMDVDNGTQITRRFPRCDRRPISSALLRIPRVFSVFGVATFYAWMKNATIRGASSREGSVTSRQSRGGDS